MLSDELAEKNKAVKAASDAIRGVLRTGLSLDNAREIAGYVKNLSDSFSALAAIETEKLFPALRASPDGSLKLAGEKFEREIQWTASKVASYASVYTVPEEIAAAQRNFPPVTMFLLETLENCLERQTAELYPLAEHIQAEGSLA